MKHPDTKTAALPDCRRAPRRRRAAWRACWCVCSLVLAVVAAAALGVTPEQLIAALFGDATEAGDGDVNGDRRVSAADLVTLSIPTPVGQLYGGSLTALIAHSVDDTLIYQVTTSTTAPVTETAKVIRSDPDGTFVVDVTQAAPSKKHEQQAYQLSDAEFLFTGLTTLGGGVGTQFGIITCNPPLIRLARPLVAWAGATTMSKCTLRALGGAFLGEFTLRETFTAIQVLDSFTVAAGTYAAVIQIMGTRSLGSETDEIYISPGVGVILQLATTGGQTTRRELTDGTVGGRSVRP